METEFVINNLEFSEILPEKYTWQEAMNLGKSKWRLPSKSELRMLYEKVPESRCKEWLWTASLVANNRNYMWLIYFSCGSDGYGVKTENYSVRLVRETN